MSINPKNLKNRLFGFNFRKIFLSRFFLLLLIFSLGILTGFGIFKNFSPKTLNHPEAPKDKYVAFILESFDKINQNYWDNISPDQLANLYKQNIEKLTGRPQKLNIRGKKDTPQNSSTQVLPGNNLGSSLNLEGSSVNDLKIMTQNNKQETSTTRQALEQMLDDSLKEIDKDKKKDFSVQLISQILASLQPNGRSALYTQKLETQLKNTVQNINPQKDLYKDLGLNKGASPQAVQQAYQQKEQDLKKDNSPKAQEQLKQLAYAKDVLTDQDKKKNYDTAGIEPTTSASHLISKDIAYLKFDKFSPTTYEEFIKIVTSYDKDDGPKALVFDLRGNIGGAIDALPFFLGNFLGDKQYVYDFMKKGELEPYKTVGSKLGGLSRMKQVVILVDNQTQSSAELLTAALKRYHFGVVVGVPTRGWGTVEKVFQMDNQIDEGEKYSILLVHSITLRDDNQPVEGRGVEPDINIKDLNWEQKLFEYFRNTELVEAAKKVM